MYVNGRLSATVRGWCSRNQNSGFVDDYVREYGQQYGHYCLVDIPQRAGPDPQNGRDIVWLSPEELAGEVAIQLRLDKPVGPKLVVLVESSIATGAVDTVGEVCQVLRVQVTVV